jgi:hypothetical protein
MSDEKKRKRARTSASTSDENPKLQLAQAINAIKKNQESFKKSVDSWTTVNDDIFTNLELKLQAKTKELEQLEVDYTNKKRQKKIEIDAEVRESGYAAVQKILEDRKEVAVPIEKWNALNKNYEELKSSHTKNLQDAVSEERARNEKDMKALKKQSDLEHATIMAQSNAKIDQQAQQLKVLEATIQSLKQDIDAQRNLTREIAVAANSGSRPNVMYERPVTGRHE